MIERFTSIRTRSLFRNLCTSLFLILSPGLASAETFTCTAGDVGCVIASIAKSNANGPDHDYLFLQAGTYMLTRPDNTSSEGANGLPVITGALTLVGAGQGITLLARDPEAPLFRILEVAPTGGFTIAYITLSHGEVSIPFSQRGGCILNRGSFMLYHSTVRECSAHRGGGIRSLGQQTLFHATIIENYAEIEGGGCSALGPTLIESSWIGNNVAEGTAGCEFGSRTPVTIRRSVFADNIASRFDGGGLGGVGVIDVSSTLLMENVSGGHGGGIDLENGTLTISNSTLWDNDAAIDGGGLYVTQGEAHLRGVAVLFNEAGIPAWGIGQGGGVATSSSGDGTVHLENSWLLWNKAGRGAECAGNVTTSGWVVIGDPTKFHEGPPCE